MINVGHVNVSVEKVTKCAKCGAKELTQDPDTLDTWFSSALWPFSTLGWPENTEDLKTFYPTNTLVTGYDIIFFWVVRMMFSAIEQTGTIPFKDVLIHGIVRDSQGRKMSKSLGNGIDPLEIVDKYSADALRFSLISGNSIGNDMRFLPEKLESAKNFGNKIWNVSKFVLMNIEDYNDDFKEINLMIEDRWILSRLNNLIKNVYTNMEEYNLGVALDNIYEFIWNEFCDWYVEIVKARLYDKENISRKAAQFVLKKVLEDSLKLLHPFMPFVTEKIYKSLNNNSKSIMISEFPKYREEQNNTSAENYIEEIKRIITEIRNVRAKMNVHPSKKAKLIIVTKTYENEAKQSSEFLKKLGFADTIIIKKDKIDIPQNAINILSSNLEVFIPFEELIDIKEEIARITKEKEKLLIEMEKVDNMLNNEGFIKKAPAQKVKEVEEKKKEYLGKLNNIEERMRKITNKE